MRQIGLMIILLASIGMASSTYAKEENFTGTWVKDLRSKSERERGVECGMALFSLLQVGAKITGDHTFSTPGCGRLNEGGDGTVKGLVIGTSAVLVVTSGRNNAIVMGKATRKGNTLHWITLEEIKGGDPEDDSPLILGKGILELVKPSQK